MGKHIIMNIDEKLLTKIEKLSSLKIEDSKREEMIKEMANILNFVENLNELDLKNEDASFSIISGGTPFRDDSPSLDPQVIETILNHAPKQNRGFFVVPKIID